MKFIKTIISTSLVVTSAFAQINIPALSPSSTLTQKIGIAEAKVEYSRPSVRGRKIFGEVIKFGEPWRTGANSPTKISFSDTVVINSKKIVPGTYGLFTIPKLDSWTVVLSKNTWAYAWDQKEADDVVRFSVKSDVASPLVETFTIDFANLTRTSADLMMTWENTSVKFTITTDPDKKIMADIDSKINNFDTYWGAANYYFDNNKDLKKALEWATIAIDKNPQFWSSHLKAKIYSKMGDCPNAVIAAKKSMEMAVAAKNDDYIKNNQKIIDECPVVPAKASTKKK